MIDFVKNWVSLGSDRRAVTALEYAMIAGIVVAVIAVGFGYFAGDLASQFNTVGGSL